MTVASLIERFSNASPALLVVILDAALKSAAILALAAATVLMLRRASAAVRHLLWVLATVSLVVLPAISAALPGWHILPRWAAGVSAPVAQPTVVPPAPVHARAAVPVFPPPPEFTPPSPRLTEVAPFAPPASPEGAPEPTPVAFLPAPVPVPEAVHVAWQAWVLLAWSAAAVLLLARLALGYASLWWLERRSTRITAGAWPHLLESLRKQLCFHRPIELLMSPHRSMPMTWGIFRTRLLLPADSAAWSADERRTVLLHEMAHAKRRDCLTQLLVQITCALYWFNPLVWIAWHRIQAERERACDDLVLASGTRPSAYAEQLLHIASNLPPARFSAAAIAMARPSKLEGRLLAILSGNQNRRALTWGTIIAAIVTTVAIAIPMACMKAHRPAMREATITLAMDVDSGRHLPGAAVTLKVTDAKELEELQSYFPEMDKGKTAPRAAGWVTGAEVSLVKEDGKTLRIAVSSNDDLTVWSEGHGDWPVRGDFKAFLRKLQKQRAAADREKAGLTEAAIAGMWVAGGPQVQGLAETKVLWLGTDHKWIEAYVYGPLAKPARVADRAAGTGWALAEERQLERLVPDSLQSGTVLRLRAGGESLCITRPSPTELVTARWGDSIVDIQRFVRADANVAGALLAALQVDEPAIPETAEVVLTAEPDRPEAAIGDPVLVTLHFRNVGKSTYWVEEDFFGPFHGAFTVRDAVGKVVENPYAGGGIGSIDGPMRSHELKPGGEVSYQRLLNECVRFDKPGEYSVEPLAFARTSQKYESGVYRRPKVVAGKITIKDFDPARRAADIAQLVAAYKAEDPLPEKLPFDRKYFLGQSGSLGIVRWLAFFNDPSLTGFFLDVMEGTDWNGYARCGLLGMRDRDAVFKAFEARLAHPESHDVGKLIYAYEQMKYPPADWTDREKSKAVNEQRRAAEAKYRTIALALVKGDKEYRYGYLIPWLANGPATGGPDDQFLIEYLFRGKPKFEWVRQSAAVLNRVKLPREFEPALVEQLKVRDWTVSDAAIRQLVRIDPEKYLPMLRAEIATKRFSPEAYKLLDVSTQPATAPATNKISRSDPDAEAVEEVPGGTLKLAAMEKDNTIGWQCTFLPDKPGAAKSWTMDFFPAMSSAVELSASLDGKYLAVFSQAEGCYSLEVLDLAVLLRDHKTKVLATTDAWLGGLAMGQWQGSALAVQSHELLAAAPDKNGHRASLPRLQDYLLDAATGKITAVSEDAKNPLPVLIAEISSNDGERAYEAARAFVQLHAVESLPALRQALAKTTDKDARAAVQKAVQELEASTQPATAPSTTHRAGAALTPQQAQARNELLVVDQKLRQGLVELAKTYPQLAIANNQPLEKALAKDHAEAGPLLFWFGRSNTPAKGPWQPEKITDDQQWNLMAVIKPVAPGGSSNTVSAMAVFPLYPHLNLQGQCHGIANDPKLNAALEKLLANALVPLAELDAKAAKDLAAAPGRRLVADPVAAIRKVLPPGLVVQRVIENTSPFYLEKGRGREIQIGKPVDVVATQPHKVEYQFAVWIMPPDYVGREANPGTINQTTPPSIAASASDATIFMWPYDGGDLGKKILAAVLTDAPATAPDTSPAVDVPLRKTWTEFWLAVDAKAMASVEINKIDGTVIGTLSAGAQKWMTLVPTAALDETGSKALAARCATGNATFLITTPAEKGRARAAADIKANMPRIAYYGKPWSVGKPLVDDASGLRVEILEGCAATPDFVAETDAYNATMRQWASEAQAEVRYIAYIVDGEKPHEWRAWRPDGSPVPADEWRSVPVNGWMGAALEKDAVKVLIALHRPKAKAEKVATFILRDAAGKDIPSTFKTTDPNTPEWLTCCIALAPKAMPDAAELELQLGANLPPRTVKIGKIALKPNTTTPAATQPGATPATTPSSVSRTLYWRLMIQTDETIPGNKAPITQRWFSKWITASANAAGNIVSPLDLPHGTQVMLRCRPEPTGSNARDYSLDYKVHPEDWFANWAKWSEIKPSHWGGLTRVSPTMSFPLTGVLPTGDEIPLGSAAIASNASLASTGYSAKMTIWLIAGFDLTVPATAPATSPATTPPTDAEYLALMRRVFQKVVDLKQTHPTLAGIAMPEDVSLDDWSTSTLAFQYNATRVRDNPKKPADKSNNGEHTVFGQEGFEFQLHFYKGPYPGAAMFLPYDFGDLNLWFSWDEAHDAKIAQAVSLALLEEQEAFAKAHGLAVKHWILDRAELSSATASSATTPAKDAILTPRKLQQESLESPDWKGPLSTTLKVRAQADTWDQLVADLKPAFTWGKPQFKPVADCGFPNLLWIDEKPGGKLTFRLARAFTWKLADQKARWIVPEIVADVPYDALAWDQVASNSMPAEIPLVAEKPQDDHFPSYAIVKSSHPQGGTLYEIGWQVQMSGGTGHYESRRPIYLWRDTAKKWRLLGEGPEEMAGKAGGMDSVGAYSETTVAWKGDPVRPVVTFAASDWDTESGESAIGLPDKVISRDAILDATRDPLPATLQWSNEDYIAANENDTLDLIVHRLTVWDSRWNPYEAKPDAKLLQTRRQIEKTLRDTITTLNPKLPNTDAAVLAKGTRVIIATRTPPVAAPATAPATRAAALDAGHVFAATDKTWRIEENYLRETPGSEGYTMVPPAQKEPGDARELRYFVGDSKDPRKIVRYDLAGNIAEELDNTIGPKGTREQYGRGFDSAGKVIKFHHWRGGVIEQVVIGPDGVRREIKQGHGMVWSGTKERSQQDWLDGQMQLVQKLYVADDCHRVRLDADNSCLIFFRDREELIDFGVGGEHWIRPADGKPTKIPSARDLTDDMHGWGVGRDPPTPPDLTPLYEAKRAAFGAAFIKRTEAAGWQLKELSLPKFVVLDPVATTQAADAAETPVQIYARYLALIAKSAQAANKDEALRLTDDFAKILRGRLLQIYVSRRTAANDWESILSKTYAARAVKLPKIKYASTEAPHVSPQSDEGAAYILIETGPGKYDIYITMALAPEPAATQPAEKKEYPSTEWGRVVKRDDGKLALFWGRACYPDPELAPKLQPFLGHFVKVESTRAFRDDGLFHPGSERVPSIIRVDKVTSLADSPAKLPLVTTFTTSKKSYALGEPIDMTVRVRNTTRQEIDLHLYGSYPSLCRNYSERFALEPENLYNQPHPYGNPKLERVQPLGAGQELEFSFKSTRMVDPGVYQLLFVLSAGPQNRELDSQSEIAELTIASPANPTEHAAALKFWLKNADLIDRSRMAEALLQLGDDSGVNEILRLLEAKAYSVTDGYHDYGFACALAWKHGGDRGQKAMLAMIHEQPRQDAVNRMLPPTPMPLRLVEPLKTLLADTHPTYRDSSGWVDQPRVCDIIAEWLAGYTEGQLQVPRDGSEAARDRTVGLVRKRLEETPQLFTCFSPAAPSASAPATTNAGTPTAK